MTNKEIVQRFVNNLHKEYPAQMRMFTTATLERLWQQTEREILAAESIPLDSGVDENAETEKGESPSVTF